jgi:hypothetical protein
MFMYCLEWKELYLATKVFLNRSCVRAHTLTGRARNLARIRTMRSACKILPASLWHQNIERVFEDNIKICTVLWNKIFLRFRWLVAAFSRRMLGLEPSVVHLGIVVDKMTLAQVILVVIWFFPLSMIPQFHHAVFTRWSVYRESCQFTSLQLSVHLTSVVSSLHFSCQFTSLQLSVLLTSVVSSPHYSCQFSSLQLSVLLTTVVSSFHFSCQFTSLQLSVLLTSVVSSPHFSCQFSSLQLSVLLTSVVSSPHFSCQFSSL